MYLGEMLQKTEKILFYPIVYYMKLDHKRKKKSTDSK